MFVIVVAQVEQPSAATPAVMARFMDAIEDASNIPFESNAVLGRVETFNVPTADTMVGEDVAVYAR